MDRLHNLHNSPNRQLIRCLHHEKQYLNYIKKLENTTDKKQRYNIISNKSKHKIRGIKDAINYYKITGRTPDTIFTRELIAILAMDKDLNHISFKHGKRKRPF